MEYPFLPYAITELYLLVFSATVWFRLNGNMGSEHEVRQLRNMLYSYFSMLATDIVWALMEDGIVRLPVYLNAAVNAITVISVSCGCYYWFKFIEDRLHFASLHRRTLDRLIKIPILLIAAADVVSIFTGWIFYIDTDGHYETTDMFMLQGVVNYFYLLVPTVYSVYRAVKTRSRQDRAEYITYALYMIAPLLSGLTEDIFPRVPLLSLNIFMMLLILFLMIQNMQVFNDALTGLNNRRRLWQYLDAGLAKATEEHPLLLLMMDINDFKSINDNYGHLEGDDALKTLAEVLKDIAAKYGAFAARYGGDEFCMVANGEGLRPEEIAQDVQDGMSEAEVGEGIGARRMTVSIGYAVCEGSERYAEEAIAKADKMLYENKRRWHRQIA